MSKHIFYRDSTFYLYDKESMGVFILPDSLKELTEKEIRVLEKEIKISEGKCFVHESRENQDVCNRLVLNVTDDCNLKCKYCYANHGDYGIGTSINFMKEETMKLAIDFVYGLYPLGVNQIQFFGGEPLLNSKMIFETCEYINNYCKTNNFTKPCYTMVTNGTIISDSIIDGLNKYFTSVTISLDGKKHINDKGRIFGTNINSVFDTVMQTIEQLNSSNRKYDLCIETTITKFHIEEDNPLESNSSVDFLQKLNVDYYQVAPAFDSSDCGITVSELPMEDVIQYFDSWFKNYQEYENSSVAGIVHLLHKKKSGGNSCGACNTDITIDVNGDVYPCFMFIGHNQFKISNIGNYSIDFVERKNSFIREKLKKANRNPICDSCWAQKLCASSFGHCIGLRYMTTRRIDMPDFLACEIGKTVIERSIVTGIDKYASQRDM